MDNLSRTASQVRLLVDIECGDDELRRVEMGWKTRVRRDNARRAALSTVAAAVFVAGGLWTLVSSRVESRRSLASAGGGWGGWCTRASRRVARACRAIAAAHGSACSENGEPSSGNSIERMRGRPKPAGRLPDRLAVALIMLQASLARMKKG